MNTMLTRTLAPNTNIAYTRAYNKYNQFCIDNNLQTFPIHETNLMLYITSISSTSISNINVTIAAIKHQSIIQGYHEAPSFPRLYMLVRALKRTSKHKKNNIITYAFLRSSEYTSSHVQKYDSNNTLCYQDITRNGNLLLVNIKSSKTDPFRQGCVVKLAPSLASLCPVTALNNFLAVHPKKSGPVFTYANGSYLTRRRLNHLFKLALPHENTGNVSTHSLRIGAATTAAAAGLPRWLIQSLGRWNSDCFRTYIRIPTETINNVSNLLANTLGNDSNI